MLVTFSHQSKKPQRVDCGFFCDTACTTNRLVLQWVSCRMQSMNSREGIGTSRGTHGEKSILKIAQCS